MRGVKVRFFVKISKRIKLVPSRFSSWTRIPRNVKGSVTEGYMPKVPTIGFRGKESL